VTPIVSRSIVAKTFAALLAVALGLAATSPARADGTKLTTSSVRSASAGAAPVVEYDGAATNDIERASQALPGFGEPSAYEAFEPEHIVRATPPHHESLLARARRAASRILAVVKNLPHF
jgi:hypothetical protein